MLFASDRVTRAGGRQHNEDACDELSVGNAGCWVVADGLGGHRGGETASTVAVQAVLASFQSNQEFSAAALQQHLEAAQQAVLKAQKEEPRLAGMRTTIVVLIADAQQAMWAHVGDSRFYCFDAGRIAFHTRDHSMVQAMVNAGELPSREIRHHPDRNRLLRALGNPNGGFRPEIVPQSHTLYRGTAFLLCTDGFWENVSEAEMEIDLAKAESPRDWLGKMETRLMERTTEESDNYTAMAVFFDSESAPIPPAPNLMEDREMNGSFRRDLGTTAVLAGILLIALAAAALGAWNWLAIRQINQAESNDLKNLQPQLVPADIAPKLSNDIASLERLCSDSNLKPLCAGTAPAQRSTGALGGTPATRAASDPDAKPKPEKKSKKVKKAAKENNS